MSKSTEEAGAHLVIGTLLEAAIRDQQAIKEAVGTLNRATDTLRRASEVLPDTVAKEVDASLKAAINGAADTLVKRFEDANVKAARASTAYKEAAEFSMWRIVIPALGITALAGAVIVIAAWMAMPNLTEVQALRNERDRLQHDLSILEERGAKSDTRTCQLTTKSKRGRLCVKLDPQYGDQWGGYRIVADK
jgi:hypothetical protein